MTLQLTRRTFVSASLGAGALLVPARRGIARESGRVEEPLFRISLAQWSLHRALQSGALDPLDFASVTREEYGLQAVEYVNSFFKERAADFEYLGQLKHNAERAEVRSLLIMVDGEGDLGDKNLERRQAAIENHFKWIAAAGFLGCHAIRVNAGGVSADEAEAGIVRVADSLSTLARLGQDYGIAILVENHGGLSSRADWLARAIAAADHPQVGTLPDFGNFDLGNGESYDRYQGVEELMPFAKAVSAKSHAFDEDGNETYSDYRRLLTTVLDAGYRGFVGIEYEGSELPEPEGIRKTRELLEKVRSELVATGRWK